MSYSGLYIHIPFCLTKCRYCNFASEELSNYSELKTYIQTMTIEIKNRSPGKIDTIYFGGGTPSICEPKQIDLLLREIAKKSLISSKVEITLEVNPATVDRKKLIALKKIGINRLSLGIQSCQDKNLKFLGRKHNAKQAKNTFQLAREVGYSNIGVDLIYGLPCQNLLDFQRDLSELLTWQPDHISLYALSIEPNTLLAEEVASSKHLKISDDLVADMYIWASEYLVEKKFQHYELSNFSLLGKFSKHNLKYWTGVPYVGIGAAAHSFIKSTRSWNFSDYQSYIKKILASGNAKKGEEKLKENEKISEALIVGLRVIKGISKKKLLQKFGERWQEKFSQIFVKLKTEGLLIENKDYISLTPRGRLLSNVVFRELI